MFGPQSLPAAPPPAPAFTPPQAPSPSLRPAPATAKKPSALPIILVLAGLFLVAVIVVLIFALKK
jgi:hypothetical protein